MTRQPPHPLDLLINPAPKKRCVECRITAAKGGSARAPR
jgi:hypothetical protein